MVSTAEELRVSLDFIAAAEPAFGAAIASALLLPAELASMNRPL